MPGWAELHTFSWLRVFLLGTLTAVSFWGTGRLLCARLLADMHASLRAPAECIAGVLLMSLLVQALAMADAAHPPAPQALWVLGLAAAGGAAALAWRDRQEAAPRERLPTARWWWAPAALLAAALLTAATAPETRSDEISYHVPATARLLIDGGLRFHPLPWEASIVPQLVWHFALGPLYAVAGSAAGGVASAWLALLLAFSTGRLVAWQSGRAVLGAVAVFLALAGGYSFIFFSTAGPHAFGYLSVYTAMAAVAWSPELRARGSLRAYVTTVAVSCAGSLAGKITMLPMIALVIAMAARDVWRESGTAGERARLLAPLVIVPAAVLAPLLLWTWTVTGSPLGVLTARMMHSSFFDPQTLAAYEGTRELFASRFEWRFEAAYWSLPMVLAALAALVLEPARLRRLRFWLITLCQTLVILLLLPKELRHLGGVQYPLMAGGIVAIAGLWRERGHATRSLAALATAGALPWALFVLWIATIYLPLASGHESAARFVHRYAGLQADYEELARRLPADAKLLIGRSHSDPTQYGWYARAPVWYAPRPVLFDTAEVRRGDHVFLMYIGAGAEGVLGPIPLDPWLPPGYALGESVYDNPAARFYPSRTPAGGAGVARLEVFALTAPR
jgi:hypothetical protein